MRCTKVSEGTSKTENQCIQQLAIVVYLGPMSTICYVVVIFRQLSTFVKMCHVLQCPRSYPLAICPFGAIVKLQRMVTCSVTATSQYVPNIAHSQQYLNNERVITISIIALHDSRRITIIVVTLAWRTCCIIRTRVPLYARTVIRTSTTLIEWSLTSGRDMAVTWPWHYNNISYIDNS
jgi:hypothetical protein